MVSIDIPVVKESEMASAITFYRNDNPQKIAEAVLNSAHNEANSERLIGELNSRFTNELKELLIIKRESYTLNYMAISQFLYYGCTYDMSTIIEDVYYTDPLKYYIVEAGHIEERSKKLKCMQEYHSNRDILANVMKRFSEKIGTEGIACTITGGTDSRSILAHLIKYNIKPVLTITGKKTNPDVVIANRIAEITGSEINVIETQDGLQDLSNEDISYIAGLSELKGRYRLLKKAKYLDGLGIALECGGVGGEMYKNSFINQDFPIYMGKPNWKKFYKYKIAAWDFPTEICGEKIAEQIHNINKYVIACIKNNYSEKRIAYLDAGYYILQCRFAPVSAFQSRYIIPYNPLLERTVAAYPFGENPYRLENQAFQRRQVSENCSLIKDIHTDRDLTLNYKNRRRESVKGMLFLVKVYLNRVFKRKAISIKAENMLLDNSRVRAAIDICKRNGIICPDADLSNVRESVVDRLFSLGCFLEEYATQR